MNPSPNLALKASLRRVVSVSFKTGCEERGRNHSCPIPYLSAPAGSPGTDLTDHSTHSSRCRNRRRWMSRGEWPLGDRVRERKILHTEVRGLHACKSVLGKFGCSLDCECHTSVHCVARLSKYRPSKPVTPLKNTLARNHSLGERCLFVFQEPSGLALRIALLQVFAAV